MSEIKNLDERWNFFHTGDEIEDFIKKQFRLMQERIDSLQEQVEGGGSHVEPPTSVKNVIIGHGADYASAVFTDTGHSLSTGMHLTQAVSKNDYLFIKVDKTQGILLATTDNDDPTFNSEIQFDAPFTDGDYKVYKKTDAYPRAITARILIVTIN